MLPQAVDILPGVREGFVCEDLSEETCSHYGKQSQLLACFFFLFGKMFLRVVARDSPASKSRCFPMDRHGVKVSAPPKQFHFLIILVHNIPNKNLHLDKWLQPCRDKGIFK